ncbi:MAG: SCP2 sterol-binding domain-containing protein [Myxococcales bacterium]|nr:SCP2 sterol-binding domain-containing protein [Myxococcales bacterium]MCB9652194.1 SCP2 sterol-binding domain-containing protein [Deltaproteobacteria bacterium]
MTFSATEYLGTVLPALIQSREGPGPLPDAVVQFTVTDGEPVSLAYRLSPTEGLEVLTGVSDRQDLTLIFLTEDLERFAQGTLDVQAALRSRRLKVHGDPALLAWVADHLST